MRVSFPHEKRLNSKENKKLRKEDYSPYFRSTMTSYRT